MIHQIWTNHPVTDWSLPIRKSVAKWTRVARGDGLSEDSEMAWFLWDERGIDVFMRTREPSLYEDFKALPYSVEKADVFRIAVLKWFGGVVCQLTVGTLVKHCNSLSASVRRHRHNTPEAPKRMGVASRR